MEARRNGYIAKGQGSARISNRSEAGGALERTFAFARARTVEINMRAYLRLRPFNIAIQLTRRAYHALIKNLRSLYDRLLSGQSVGKQTLR